jgi:(1->4)-alpha-D-glucan 1-alpha-D-glucosylmutase
MAEKLAELVREPELPRMKLFLIWRALEFRRQQREIFDFGGYAPVASFGSHKEHLCAFARRHRGQTALVVTPRLVCTLTRGAHVAPMGSVWEDTILPIPWAKSGAAFRNVFSGEVIKVSDRSGVQMLELAQVLKDFPVALLHQ